MCNTLFSNLSPCPSEILYVIGNGFDIAHGIKSQYRDFAGWVKESYNQQLINMMDMLFINEHDLWSDIETALGEYREDEILECLKPKGGIDYDHPMRSIAAIEDMPDCMFKPVLNEFLERFADWVNSIEILQARRMNEMPELEKQSKYLTFNYTETLEKVYAIPETNVLHIHGSRTKAIDGYIMGHNKIKSDALHDTLNGEYYFEQNSKNKIISLMNDLYKPTSSIIRNNKNFFQSLTVITHVVVIGHSLNNVDRIYFDEIRSNVQLETKWIFYYHTDVDKKQIEEYINYSKIGNHKMLRI